MMEDSTQLEDLPLDCLTQIIGLMKAEDVVSAMQVSRTLRAVAGSALVWQDLTWNDFGIHASSHAERDTHEPPRVRVLSPSTAAPPPPPTLTPYEVAEALAAEDARRGRRWRRLYAAVRSSLATKTRVLRVHGLFTDGGVDENEMDNWVGRVVQVELR
jgi:hypothetical protein